jgi:hypothetical protein
MVRDGRITEARLAEMADQSMRASDDSVREIEVVDRQRTGSSKSPSLMQIVRFVADDDGVAHDLVAFQLLATSVRRNVPV